MPQREHKFLERFVPLKDTNSGDNKVWYSPWGVNITGQPFLGVLLITWAIANYSLNFDTIRSISSLEISLTEFLYL